VLIINGITETGEPTPVQYVSTPESILDLARVFDYEYYRDEPVYAAWINAFDKDTTAMANELYQQAIMAKSLEWRTRVATALSTVLPIDLPSTNGSSPIESYELLSHIILQQYDLPKTSEDIRKRAKILHYIRENQALLTTTSPQQKKIRNQIIQTLDTKEADMRIHEALLSFDGPNEISNESLLARVLSKLV
jgi:hypothetical protein